MEDSPWIMPRTLSIQEEESSKDMLIGWCSWLVLVGVAEWGMMGTCRPMSSPYMFPTSAQQYSTIPTTPINHHRPPLYQQRPSALFRVVSVRDPIAQISRTPSISRTLQTLGTRTKIPTRHMLDTLGVQTTSDSNVPSGQKLGLLKMHP